VAAGAQSMLSLPSSEPPTGDWHRQRFSQLVRRDRLVRGALIAILGALLFVASIKHVPEHGFFPTVQNFGIPLLALTALALLGYGVLGAWSLGHEKRIEVW
jgi:hypothetical protein